MRIGFSSHALKPPGPSIRLALGLNINKWDGGWEKFSESMHQLLPVVALVPFLLFGVLLSSMHRNAIVPN